MSESTPLAQYRALLAAGELQHDDAQELAVEKLQILHHRLATYKPPNGGGGFKGFFRFDRREPVPEGLYLYGGVGRGKSMLMDLFYAGAPVEKKRRVHFIQFMMETHAAIHDWRQRHKRGETPRSDGDDPIPPVAAQIADRATLLCFDEFQVSDVADAMILGRLFGSLFDLGVVVVATSNRAPDQLYEGGLNRQLFLPSIALIKERMDVLHLNSPHDYRLERILGAPVYHTPLGPDADAALDDAWRRLTDHDDGERDEITVQGRTLVVPQAAKGVARFSFTDLCERPLGGADYLALSWQYHTLLVDRIPVMKPHQRNEARRFVSLIDALYDNHVKLICSAAAKPDSLYAEGDGTFEFQRTVSRLQEMQSEDYLAAGHAV